MCRLRKCITFINTHCFKEDHMCVMIYLDKPYTYSYVKKAFYVVFHLKGGGKYFSKAQCTYVHAIQVTLYNYIS